MLYIPCVISNSMREDEAYLIGMLQGKGNLTFEKDEAVRLWFTLKYRKPTVDAKRKDNLFRTQKNVIPINESTGRQSISYNVFNNMVDLSNKFSSILNTDVRLERVPQEGENWKKKNISMVSDNISVIDDKLCEIFGVEKIIPNVINHIPKTIRETKTPNLARGYLQGLADATALPPSHASSAYGSRGEKRIQFEINWSRWYIPVETCNLVQSMLSMHVWMINWGHPNIRGVNSYRGQNHQLRIGTKEFGQIGFRLDFKKKALQQQLKSCKKSTHHCPFDLKEAKERIFKCTSHNENDTDIPSKIRGLHFDKNYQICYLLGCKLLKGKIDTGRIITPTVTKKEVIKASRYDKVTVDDNMVKINGTRYNPKYFDFEFATKRQKKNASKTLKGTN